MAQVILKNVDKTYDNKVRVVKDVNLEIKDKEFMVLVGPSGCGKTTTLRMIAGLEEITEGEILIGDRVVNNIPPKDRDIAMVFQNYALYPHMTVFENLAFGLKLRKFDKDDIKARVDEAAEILGLEHLLDRKPKQLSGGQRQRVAVGRAIVRHPRVFLFDEPLSNLDAKLRVAMRAELSKLHQRLQTTMIYVTHDQTEAMTMGSRITVLKDGILQQVDTPLNLYDHPINMFVAGFIGSPAMNMIKGRLDKSDGLVFTGEGVKLPVPAQFADKLANYVGKPLVMGVRPEHVSLGKSGHAVARVDVVEPMGNEIFIHTSVGKDKLLARVITRALPAPGENLNFDFNTDYLHFFDPQTELCLNYSL